MRNFLLILILLLWLALGYKMCTDYSTCCVEKVTEVIPPPVVEKAKPCLAEICFDVEDCNPHFCPRWPSYRDSLLNAIGNNQKLVITGRYGPSEKHESNYDNLGLCRADTIRRAMLPYAAGKAIEIIGQLRVGLGAGNDGYSCERHSFTIVDLEKQIKTSTLIYFPYNSTDKLSDATVETYLDNVAARVISSGERVRLTGHTDNHGSIEYNLNLGRRRANIIKSYLVSKGVTPSKIITNSEGESRPVATNATDAGRAKNRRTELEIIN